MVTDLKSIADVIGDGLHGTPEYDDNGQFFFINGNNLNETIEIKIDTKRVNEEEYNKYKKPLNSNTILLSINGTLGNFARYNNEPVILGKSACYINIKQGYNVDYISWFLKSKVKSDFERNATGTTIKNISLKQIREFQINLPDGVVQEKIAKTLNSILAKIDVNNKINRNLSEQAKVLYKSWFVDYEPFDGISPSDWEDGTVDDLASEIVCGKTPSTKKQEYYGEDMPFVTIPDMHGSVYVVTTARSLSELGVKSQVKKTLPKNSICVSCIGTAGLVVLLPGECQTNQQINSIIPKVGYSPYYIYLMMLTMSETINKLGQSGSTIVNLNKAQFGKMSVMIPSVNSMKEFDEIVAPIFSTILSNQYENIKLAELRDSLLPRLMSGELDVTDIDI